MPRPSPAKPNQIGIEEIPVAIKTVTIDGKRITPGFYRQIMEEAIIDENTGTLLGKPLGYINVHQKECPEHWHLHVLWRREEALYQSLVTRPSDSKRYQALKKQYDKRSNDLMDMLALLLSQSARTPEDTYYYALHDADVRHSVSLGGYKNLLVSSSTYHLLVQLEQARQCLDQAQEAWQEQQP